MRIAVPKELAPHERRVAIVPETVKRLVACKLEVVVQTGAGMRAGAGDEDYRAAGATIAASPEELFRAADVVVKVQVPTLEEIAGLREGCTLVSLLYPLVNPALVAALAERKITALAADTIPRTTLAQMMDVLSSQATIAGYRSVILAAEALPKLFPMLMTAAGTIAPARVVVLGAGVAGLQAIATARRLGAVVEAFDVRKVAKEQVESLGARFIEVESGEDAQTAGGYAKEVSADYQKKQAALLLERLSKCDCCITTALIPGKRAPVLVTEEMVAAMRPGTVVVDIAAEQGGNCALTRPGERVVTANGVTIVGELNLPSQLAVHASQMYSRNMEKLLLHLLGKDGVEFKFDRDEITRAVVITKQGEVVDANVAAKLGAVG
jgi:NAD(P) transhydrogenase subunit alpha